MSEVAQQNTSTSIMVRRVSLVPLYLAPREESLGITTGCGSPHEAWSTRQLDAADEVREEQNLRCTLWSSQFCPFVVLRTIDPDALSVSFVRCGLSEM